MRPDVHQRCEATVLLRGLTPMTTTATYAISEAARRAGATVHQVRSYVASGLARPCTTTAGGHFVFDEDCVARLRLIAAATRAGLHIADIGTLIKALARNDRRAILAAYLSLAASIDTRQAAIQRLCALIAQTRGASVPEAARHFP